jgi:hypothetical protein
MPLFYPMKSGVFGLLRNLIFGTKLISEMREGRYAASSHFSQFLFVGGGSPFNTSPLFSINTATIFLAFWSLYELRV